ncbi:MAG: dihydroorotate dehydrogenase (quinone), partial [Chitinophagales bacterium]
SLYLKIAPDLTWTQVDEVIEVVQKTQIDGLILSNTTIARSNLLSKNQTEKGGLSGRPVTQRSTDLIAYVRERLKAPFALIGVGGIFTPQDAQAKINAGANLVQVYTGLVYEGPDMVKRIKKHLVIAKKKP